MTAVFEKSDPSAPRGFYACEATGLRWLAEATASGGAPVVLPLGEVTEASTGISLPRIETSEPSAEAARSFGAQLAQTHAAGAPHHGAMPPGSPQNRGARGGFIGKLAMPLAPPGLTWEMFFAEYRLLPFARSSRDRGALSPAGVEMIERVAARLVEGRLDTPDEAPVRQHGDLWSGNVLWTPQGAVLIDPSAHGGHRESDLAMLALFGAPYVDEVIAGYQDVAPFAPGWQRRTGLHQLYPLLVHAALFGGGYGPQAMDAARAYL